MPERRRRPAEDRPRDRQRDRARERVREKKAEVGQAGGVPRRTPHFPLDRPQVAAHRGSSEALAEHTLGAYLAALEEGAEALECDVRLTADGHLVCVHDRSLKRTALAKGLISTSELAQLDDLDFARWKNPWSELDEEWAEPDAALAKVLTLRKLLETVAEYPRRVDLAIETKHPTRYAGLVERRLVELLAEFGWTGADAPVRVMSFSWVALRRIERLAPDLDLVYLFDTAGEWLRAKPMVRPYWIAGPSIVALRETPEAVRKMAERHRVHVWVVNTEADLRLCRDLGVEAVISDKPGTVLRWLASE